MNGSTETTHQLGLVPPAVASIRLDLRWDSTKRQAHLAVRVYDEQTRTPVYLATHPFAPVTGLEHALSEATELLLKAARISLDPEPF